MSGVGVNMVSMNAFLLDIGVRGVLEGLKLRVFESNGEETDWVVMTILGMGVGLTSVDSSSSSSSSSPALPNVICENKHNYITMITINFLCL